MSSGQDSSMDEENVEQDEMDEYVYYDSSDSDKTSDESSDSDETSDEEIPDDKDGLVDAARHGMLEVVKALVDGRSSDVNCRERVSGWTPLTIACYNGHRDVAEYLIDKGADLNKYERRKDLGSMITHPHELDRPLVPAIFAACENGHADIVELLLERGADLHVTHSRIKSVSGPINVPCDNEQIEALSILLADSATTISDVCTGWSLLTIAAFQGHNEIVKNLLKRGARVNERDAWGTTALDVACDRGHNNVIVRLLAHGVSDEQSVLHRVCKTGQVEVLRTLLNHGTVVEGKDYSHWDLFRSACDYSNYEVVKELLERAPNDGNFGRGGLTPLHDVWRSASKFVHRLETTNRALTMKVLLEYGIDPDSLNNDGLSVMELIRACLVTNRDADKLDRHVLTILLDFDAGCDVICRVHTCSYLKTTPVALCIYKFYRSFECSAPYGDTWGHIYCDKVVAVSIIAAYEKYFIKTKLAGLPQLSNFAAPDPPLKEVDWDVVNRELFREKCEAELKRIKSDEISDTGATYFSLLARDLPFLRYKHLYGKVRSGECTERYPIYGTMIYSSYVKLRCTFLEEECLLFFTLNSPSLPPECADIVLRRLSERDLKNIFTVYCTHVSFVEGLRDRQNDEERKKSRKRKFSTQL